MKSLPPSVRQHALPIPHLRVSNGHATALICLQGAQVMRYQSAGAAPLLWAAEEEFWVAGKNLRGGVPVCWPWFGPHAREAALPQHGWVRQRDWQLVEAVDLADQGTRLVLEAATAVALPDFPPTLHARMDITIGKTLKLSLTSRNSGAGPVRVEDALHSYFLVGDARDLALEHLGGLAYLDLLDGMKEKREPAGVVRPVPPVTRVYRDAPDRMVIADPVLRRRIFIRTQGCRSAVLWSPGEATAATMSDLVGAWTRMVCLESGNCKEAALVLAPGAAHSSEVEYSVEPWPPA